MTSSRLFFRAMREDLKHKIWMLALSTVASFLFVLVAFLLSDRMGYAVRVNPAGNDLIFWVETFFESTVVVTAGIVAVVGAAIVGFFSFRHLFHRNMADTYHSLPIKRSTMFWVTYLNGFLIWFVPLLLTFLIVLPLSLFVSGGGILFVQGYSFRVFAAMGTTLLYLVVVFLLIYNTILVAVMLSGNILNTIVSATMLGLGGISTYFLCMAFLAIYRESFLIVNDWDFFIYLSPLFSACNLLLVRLKVTGTGAIGENLLISGVIALLLLVAAYFLHQRRASELAGQGIKNRAAAYGLKLVAGILAGMGGWIVFSLLTVMDIQNYSVGWSIFGAVFCGVLVFGVTDIIVHMDFKAFFASKWVMLGCTTFTILLCVAFQFDWIGFDHYLPAKSDIASIGVKTYYSNKVEGAWYEEVASTDQELIYEILKRGVANVGKREELVWSETASLPVCVTMKNGRTYYRDYTLTREDEEVFRKLLLEPEYIEKQYILDEKTIESRYHWSLNGIETNMDIKREEVRREILTAYNQDVRETPELFVSAEDNVLAKIYISGNDIFITDKMVHTLNALKKNGYEDILSRPALESVQEVTLNMSTIYWEIPHEEMEEDSEIQWIKYSQEYKKDFYDIGEEEYELKITDKQEIAELMEVLHFNTDRRNRLLFDEYLDNMAWVLKDDGEYLDATFYYDELPEKYAERYRDMLKKR